MATDWDGMITRATSPVRELAVQLQKDFDRHTKKETNMGGTESGVEKKMSLNEELDQNLKHLDVNMNQYRLELHSMQERLEGVLNELSLRIDFHKRVVDRLMLTRNQVASFLNSEWMNDQPAKEESTTEWERQ